MHFCDETRGFAVPTQTTRQKCQRLGCFDAPGRSPCRAPVTDPSPSQALLETLPPKLRHALEQRGILELTEVQQGVLDPPTRGRDLRVVSRTGSGKTLAFGFALLEELTRGTARPRGPRPRAVVLAPTRELACQVQRELRWALGAIGFRIEVVIGGMPFGVEARAVARGLDVLVGTPGRVLDHLQRGTLVFDDVSAVVLDEADEMLDLGFREALRGILERVPTERRSHLVSATFGPEVAALARQFQRDPYLLQAGDVGPSHADITYVLHVVAPRELEAAITNILLLAPDEATLVFVRTREGAATLAENLRTAGFAAAALTGEFAQRERTRTLDAFRGGSIRVLVATDVAARGLDIQDVTRVLHVGVPDSALAHTHRSGRTGRAGRKGSSILLVPPLGRAPALRVLAGAGIQIETRPLPTPGDVERAADARLRTSLMAAAPAGNAGDRAAELARALLSDDQEPLAVVTRLVARCREALPAQPLEVTEVRAPASGAHPRPGRGRAAERPPRTPYRAPPGSVAFESFRISWGAKHGANPRRLLALCCRRGNIEGKDVGAIDVGPFASVVEVRADRAALFARAGARADPRDPRVRITRFQPGSSPRRAAAAPPR